MTTQAETRTTTWQLDQAHTQIWFSVKHMMFATVKGQFAEFSGELELDEQELGNSAIRVEIDAASLDTRNEQRDGHLRSGDFFDVEKYPQLTFASTRIERTGGDGFRIVGDLTIRGTTREVVLTGRETGRGRDPWGNEKLGFTAETKIDRKEYGLTWNQALEAGGVLVSDEVKITIDGQAARV